MPRAEPVLLCAVAWCQRSSRTTLTMRIGERDRVVPMCGVHADGRLEALGAEADRVVDLATAEATVAAPALT